MFFDIHGVVVYTSTPVKLRLLLFFQLHVFLDRRTDAAYALFWTALPNTLLLLLFLFLLCYLRSFLWVTISVFAVLALADLKLNWI